MLGVTVQTACFMSHRIREAMRLGDLAPMGGGGSIVEVDKTYIGRKDGLRNSTFARGRICQRADHASADHSWANLSTAG
jgi:hypothetical protein